MSRGDRREPVFLEDADRRLFLDLARQRKGDPVKFALARAVAAGNDHAAEMDLRPAPDGVVEIRKPTTL